MYHNLLQLIQNELIYMYLYQHIQVICHGSLEGITPLIGKTIYLVNFRRITTLKC